MLPTVIINNLLLLTLAEIRHHEEVIKVEDGDMEEGREEYDTELINISVQSVKINRKAGRHVD